jgi:hypothetical protein
MQLSSTWIQNPNDRDKNAFQREKDSHIYDDDDEELPPCPETKPGEINMIGVLDRPGSGGHVKTWVMSHFTTPDRFWNGYPLCKYIGVPPGREPHTGKDGMLSVRCMAAYNKYSPRNPRVLPEVNIPNSVMAMIKEASQTAEIKVRKPYTTGISKVKTPQAATVNHRVDPISNSAKSLSDSDGDDNKELKASQQSKAS